MDRHLYDVFAERWLDGCDSVYLISDPHFNDAESMHFRLSSLPGEIKTLEEYNEFLVKTINRTCGKKSCLVILGDIGDESYIKKLRARRKILIMGNHDKGASNYKYISTHEGELSEYLVKGRYRVYDWFENFEETIMASSLDEAKGIGFRDLILKENSRSLFTKEPEVTCLNRIKGFDEVYEGPVMVSDRLILSHEPIEPLSECIYNIHGHIHNAEYHGDDRHMNVCAEAIGYVPVNLSSLLKDGLLGGVESLHRKTIDRRLEDRKQKNVDT